MKAISAICLVESPLQLLNVRECIEQYNLESVTIIIRFNPSRKKNETQLRKLSENKQIFHSNINFHYIYLSDSLKRFPINFLEFLKFRNDFSENYNFCIIGDLRIPWMRRYASAIKNRKFIVLDDGMASLLVRDEILKNNDFKYRQKFNCYSLKGLIGKFVSISYAAFTRSLLNFECIELFSSFIDSDSTSFSVVKNELKFISTLNKEKKTVREHWYFGSPLTERKIVDIKTELNMIKVADNYSSDNGLSFYYFAHRDDGDSKIKELSRMGIQVVNSEEPAELMLVSQSKLPQVISASGSSILITFSYLLSPQRLMNFTIPASLINEQHREHRRRIENELLLKYDIKNITLNH